MSVLHTSNPPLYKVLREGASCHGGTLTWSVPTQNADGTWTPGAWMEVDGPIMLCEAGLHLTSHPAGWWRQGTTLYRAEYEGDCLGLVGGDKFCVRRARLLHPVDWSVHQIYCEGTHRVSSGVAKAYGDATVKAYGGATVTAYEHATVEASGGATVTAHEHVRVEASGDATVTAHEHVRVEAEDDATVTAYEHATVLAHGNATVTATGCTIVVAEGDATVKAYGIATVEAYGTSTVKAYGTSTVKAYGNATVKAYGNATVISDRGHNESAQVELQQSAAHIDRRGGGLVLRSAVSEAP